MTPRPTGSSFTWKNDAELDRDFTTMVVRQFRNPQGPLAVLPELKSRGLVRDDPECAMEEDAGTPLPKGWKAYQVNPTGKRGAAYNQALERQEPAGAPCGQLGVFGLENEEETFFIAHQAHPDRLLYVNVGANDNAEADPDPSEAERTQTGQLFDISTITFRD